MQSELARLVWRRACGVGSPCRALGSSLCRRDACRVGWVLCTPQAMRSATTARELWRPRSRRTRRSWSSTSDVRGFVLAVAAEGGCGAVPRPLAARWRTMQSELARAVGRRACGVGSPCRARGSSSCRRDACRVGWVLCTPQGMRSATAARELWRRRSRRTRRSRRSTSQGTDVRGSVLAVAGEGGDVWRGPTGGGRSRARTMQSELARAVGRRACGVGSPCRARGSSSCRRDACRVGWVLCTSQTIRSATTARELWRPRSRRTQRSQSSTSTVRGSVLATGCGKGGCVARFHGRRPRAGTRCRARSRVQLWGARAASGPLAGRVAPLLVGVTLAVWVGCCARRRQ
jgi:hypothetical protein